MKWEYCRHDGFMSQSELNRYGALRWELVAITDSLLTRYPHTLYFKRPVKRSQPINNNKNGD